MKFKIGDQVIITAGKDKGKKAVITRVLPKSGKVTVEGCNMYTRHVRKMAGQAGQKMRLERPLVTAKIAILNDKGEPDRIGYKIGADGKKIRIYRKTGVEIVIKSSPSDKKTEREAKKAQKVAVADQKIEKVEAEKSAIRGDQKSVKPNRSSIFGKKVTKGQKKPVSA